MNTIQIVWILNKPGIFVKPDVGLICLQKLSADNTSRQRVNCFQPQNKLYRYKEVLLIRAFPHHILETVHLTLSAQLLVINSLLKEQTNSP